MSTDTTLSVIQGWSTLLNQLYEREQEHFFTGGERNDHQALREKVWLLFTTVDIEGFGSRFRQDYPWLLDFEGNNLDFPAAFSQLMKDPIGIF